MNLKVDSNNILEWSEVYSSILFGKGFTFFQIKNGFKNEKITQHNNYENDNCTDSYPVAIYVFCEWEKIGG